jgi:hypothetical protein
MAEALGRSIQIPCPVCGEKQRCGIQPRRKLRAVQPRALHYLLDAGEYVAHIRTHSGTDYTNPVDLTVAQHDQ